MNEGIVPVEASLKLLDFCIDKCVFERNGDPVSKNGRINYQYNFDRGVVKLAENQYRVSLQVNMETEDKSVTLHIRIVGLFGVETDDPKLKTALVTKNTLSILFPYLRSQITLVTAQSGLPPITLPIINVAAMFKETTLPEEAFKP